MFAVTNVNNVPAVNTASIVVAITVPTEPNILTANCYFWTSGASADQRRRSEERNQSTVAEYLKAIGFEVTRSGDNVVGDHESGVHVCFHYSESCKNVYKTLSITRNGKNSNVTAIRKIAAKVAAAH